MLFILVTKAGGNDLGRAQGWELSWEQAKTRIKGQKLAGVKRQKLLRIQRLHFE